MGVSCYIIKMDIMEKFCLKWNDFQENASSSFNKFRKDNDFLDVTLVSEEGNHISAHKVVLSASSEFFKDALKKANHANPMIFLSGFDSKTLSAILDYIYDGEVNLLQKEIDGFLQGAQKLKLDGLTVEEKESTFIGSDHTKSERNIYSNEEK